MKLVTMRTAHGDRLGVVTGSGVVDAEAAGGPRSLRALIDGGGAARDALSSGLAGAVVLDPSTVVHAPCVPAPGKIVCIGLNYRGHVKETGSELPAQPVVFGKFSNALAGHREDIVLPTGASEQFDYEAELCVVIGARARAVSPSDALGHVFGYCNANDLSIRDLQFRSSQWLLGKTADQFLPLGPHVVTADEVDDPQSLHVSCRVNGVQVQSSSTADMIFGVAELVSYCSAYFTLEPGDIIATGTPAGVAEGRAGQPWLRDGDVVEVEVEGLGVLSNRMVG